MRIEITGSYVNLDRIKFTEISTSGIDDNNFIIKSKYPTEGDYTLISVSGIILGEIKLNRPQL